jgi:PAS domain-containing protein
MSRYYEAAKYTTARKESDFIYRKRHGGIWRTAGSYALGVAILVFAYTLRAQLGGDLAFLILILIVLSVLTLSSVITVQKHLDLVTSIEFQNALFSSAFREGKLFSLIVSQDDQLYYADPGFYKLFPELVKSSHQVLDSIVKDSATPHANLEKLNQALISKEQQVFDVSINKDGTRVKARMSLIPLPRPAGYFFVSARLFTESRKGAAIVQTRGEEAQSILNALCEQVSDMAYVLDAKGTIICCTQAFVSMLGFKAMRDLEGRLFGDLVLTEHASYALKECQSQQVQFHVGQGKSVEAVITHSQIRGSQDSGAFTLGKASLLSSLKS